MKILVTGGAGYIGSHTIRTLLAHRHEVVIVDDFSNGQVAAVPTGSLAEPIDLRDRAALTDVCRRHRPEAVLHFAGVIEAGESVTNPQKYFDINLIGGLNLLAAMEATDIKMIVFSSTAAVYGTPVTTPITEDHPKVPINPYGLTKWQLEQALDVHAAAHGLRWVALRYFNAAGAAQADDLGEWHTPETHLIPLVLRTALGQRPAISIYGTDYPTPDGTCIRDYIHVEDLAAAHHQALDYLVGGGQPAAFNLGSGAGSSVREVIKTARSVTGRDFPVIEAARRAGDPPVLVASNDLARQQLHWQPRQASLTQQITSAWAWLQRHPEGYPRG